MTRYPQMTVTFIVTVILDQLSKYWVLTAISGGTVIPVIPNFFNLILTYNPGAAFGMMSSLPDGPRYILLALTTIVALSAVLYFFLRDYRHDVVAQVALAFIVGGAVGNIIDRVRFGMVVDFLDLQVAVCRH